MTSTLWEARGPLEAAADDNLRAIDDLYSQLRQAVHHARLDTAAIANAIGVDEGVARAMLDGREDLTVSDLEVLLIAVQARVKFDVRSIHHHEETPIAKAGEYASRQIRQMWDAAPTQSTVEYGRTKVSSPGWAKV